MKHMLSSLVLWSPFLRIMMLGVCNFAVIEVLASRFTEHGGFLSIKSI